MQFLQKRIEFKTTGNKLSIKYKFKKLNFLIEITSQIQKIKIFMPSSFQLPL